MNFQVKLWNATNAHGAQVMHFYFETYDAMSKFITACMGMTGPVTIRAFDLVSGRGYQELFVREKDE